MGNAGELVDQPSDSVVIGAVRTPIGDSYKGSLTNVPIYDLGRTVITEALDRAGVERTTLTLHVGYGTFQPVRSEFVADHRMGSEAYEVGPAAAAALSRARAEGRRVVAVGTTSTRTLESLTIQPDGHIAPASGETALFITPGHAFRVVDGLVTNFHVPRSSLLMLVSAFAGVEAIRHAYREAIAARYRFYSYGDAMLIV